MMFEIMVIPLSFLSASSALSAVESLECGLWEEFVSHA